MFGKIYKSIYEGTLRGRPHELLVFTNLISCATKHGIIDKHFRAIADEVGLTVEQVKTALANLEAPDPESRTPDEKGARIKRVDEHRNWGWKIVNYEKYRAIRCEEDRAEQNRRAQSAYRQRNQPPSATRKQSKPKSAHAEGEAIQPLPSPTLPPGPADSGYGSRSASPPPESPDGATVPRTPTDPAFFATLRAAIADPKPPPMTEAEEQARRAELKAQMVSLDSK